MSTESIGKAFQAAQQENDRLRDSAAKELGEQNAAPLELPAEPPAIQQRDVLHAKYLAVAAPPDKLAKLLMAPKGFEYLSVEWRAYVAALEWQAACLRAERKGLREAAIAAPDAAAKEPR